MAVAIVVVFNVGGKLVLDVQASEGLAAPLTFLAAMHNPNNLVSKCPNFSVEACLTTSSMRIWYKPLLYQLQSCLPHS